MTHSRFKVEKVELKNYKQTSYWNSFFSVPINYDFGLNNGDSDTDMKHWHDWQCCMTNSFLSEEFGEIKGFPITCSIQLFSINPFVSKMDTL